MRRSFISAALALAMLCGCKAGTEPHISESETVYVYEDISVTDTPQTETSLAETSETTSAAETSASISGTTAEKAEQRYNFPQEFYEELDGIFAEFPHFLYYDIALAYKDIESGFTFTIDPDDHFFSASVMKAPYMLYIYRLALEGKADLDRKVTYTEAYKREGTGVLRNMETGTEFTVEELIGYCLEESDNSAFAMLRELFPEDGYTEFMKELGVSHEDDSKAFNQPQICCGSALTISEAIYDFIEENNIYSENLKDHLTHSRNAMILGGEGSEVIRKYGWHGGNFHDLAVIRGEKDYLLSIMANFDMLVIGTEEYRLFGKLSLLIAKYSDKLIEDNTHGNYVSITIKPQEVKDMSLPKDPYMLLSVLNMKLRDIYPNFEALCDDMDADPAKIAESMKKIGYEYDPANNQFSAVPDEAEQAKS